MEPVWKKKLVDKVSCVRSKLETQRIQLDFIRPRSIARNSLKWKLFTEVFYFIHYCDYLIVPLHNSIPQEMSPCSRWHLCSQHFGMRMDYVPVAKEGQGASTVRRIRMRAPGGLCRDG